MVPLSQRIFSLGFDNGVCVIICWQGIVSVIVCVGGVMIGGCKQPVGEWLVV